MYEDIYEPAEDSFLMERIIKSYLAEKKKLLITEVGVGSGFVLDEIQRCNSSNIYSATDINPKALESTRERNNKIGLFLGNLLEPIKEKQDLIFFNTPYLPLEDGEKYEDLSIKDKAIYGGKKGYEVIEEFIYQINDKLKSGGVVFILFSSYSVEEKVKEILKLNLFEIEEEIREKHFMEELIIYKIKKTDILKKISSYNISNLKYFDRGKHSIILEGIFKKNEVIIKCEQENFIEKEGIFLEKLQKTNYVPKLYLKEIDFIVMEKLFGKKPEQFIFENSKEEIELFFQKTLNICFDLDNLNIQKFELTNPYKHIFIDDGMNVKFIDFERSIHSTNPKNTTQILQYIRRNKRQLKEKDILIDEKKILEIAKSYSKSRFKIEFKKLIS